MLRVIKRKLQEEDDVLESGMSCRSSGCEDPKRIVSHVPFRPERASVSSLISANSSLSSGQRNESCASASTSHGKVEFQQSPIATSSPQQHGFSRTVSLVSVDVTDGANRKAKKPRIEETFCQPTASLLSQGQARLLATEKDSFILSPLQ